MWYQQRADFPYCKTQLIFFCVENKQIRRTFLLIGNSLETSEVLSFASFSFLHKHKERLSTTKIENIILSKKIIELFYLKLFL